MEIFNINYVIYFQFNLVDFGDFCIFFEMSLIFKISEKLVFWIYFQLMYDECLFILVFNIMYVLNNGFEIDLQIMVFILGFFIFIVDYFECIFINMF